MKGRPGGREYWARGKCKTEGWGETHSAYRGPQTLRKDGSSELWTRGKLPEKVSGGGGIGRGLEEAGLYARSQVPVGYHQSALNMEAKVTFEV